MTDKTKNIIFIFGTITLVALFSTTFNNINNSINSLSGSFCVVSAFVG